MTITTDLAAGRLEQQLDRALADLNAARRLLKAAVARLDDSEPGYPGGGTAGGSGDDSGPIRQQVILRDEALRDRARLEADVARLEHVARSMHGVCAQWGARRVGGHVVEHDNEARCPSCIRVGRISMPRSLGGRRLCAWCEATLRAFNADLRLARLEPVEDLPSSLVAAHDRGRVTDRDWTEAVRDVQRARARRPRRRSRNDG